MAEDDPKEPPAHYPWEPSSDALSKLAASAAAGRAAYDKFEDAKRRTGGISRAPPPPSMYGSSSGYQTGDDPSLREAITKVADAIGSRQSENPPQPPEPPILPPTPERKLWSYIDKAVLSLFELLALMFGLPFGDDLFHDKPVTNLHLVYLGIGALFAIGGPMFPLVRTMNWIPKGVTASISAAARDARIWIVVLLIFFLYGVAPDIYRRATDTSAATTKPETGFTQHQVDEKIANAVTNLNAQLGEANRQRDAARREAQAFRQQIQNAPPPTRELDSPRLFTKLTPEQIGAIYDGRTPLQGDVLFGDEAGKWLETDGKVENVMGGGMFLRRGDGQQIVCSFDNTWRAKLSVLRLNDTIKVVGKLDSSHSKNSIILTSCEFSG